MGIRVEMTGCDVLKNKRLSESADLNCLNCPPNCLGHGRAPQLKFNLGERP